MQFILKTFSIVVILTTFITCTKDSTTESNASCSTVVSTYTNNVATIMNASCASAGCHSASTKAAGYDLSSYNGTKSGAANSKFLKSIKHESGADKMPQGGSKLPDASIKLIECWIANGTPQ
ncbi:MAG: hypothetical protein IPK35_06430 [Saprospiraceae bacterium]|jgi:hypothetical protein|nr:hypothetical protein [Saprospiraceae bacterium]